MSDRTDWREQARRSRAPRWHWAIPALVVALVAGGAVLAAATTTPTSTPNPATSSTPAPAPEAPGTPSPSPVASAPTPTTEVPGDPQDPEELAVLWAEAFFTRDDVADDRWQETTSGFLTRELAQVLAVSAFVEGTALAGLVPTTVQAVAVEPPDPTAEANTPIRWSHTLAIEVVDGEGETHRVRYAVVLYDTDDGWVLTDARLVELDGP